MAGVTLWSGVGGVVGEEEEGGLRVGSVSTDGQCIYH